MSENTPGIPDSPTQIGVDQWVERSDENIERPRGLAGRIAHLWELLPPAGKLAFLTPAILVPFLPFVSEGNLFNYGLFILIYALLALGLNVGLNVVLIPRWGIVGAAIAHDLSYSTAALVLLVAFVRESGHGVREATMVSPAEVRAIGRRVLGLGREAIGYARRR